VQETTDNKYTRTCDKSESEEQVVDKITTHFYEPRATDKFSRNFISLENILLQ
jgi:N-acetylneuraminic acid mutarotase